MAVPDLPSAEPTPQPPRGRLLLLLGVPVLVIAVIGAAIWLFKGETGEAAPATFELRGTISLDNSDATMGKIRDDGYRQCAGERGYSDIRAGAQVTVYDASGKAIALGSVGDSRNKDSECTLWFTVANVPGGEAIYQVEVANRGKVRYDEQQAKSGAIALTLG